MQYLEHIYTKELFIFLIWNSNIPENPVFYQVTPHPRMSNIFWWEEDPQKTFQHNTLQGAHSLHQIFLSVIIVKMLGGVSSASIYLHVTSSLSSVSYLCLTVKLHCEISCK